MAPTGPQPQIVDVRCRNGSSDEFKFLSVTDRRSRIPRPGGLYAGSGQQRIGGNAEFLEQIGEYHDTDDRVVSGNRSVMRGDCHGWFLIGLAENNNNMDYLGQVSLPGRRYDL